MRAIASFLLVFAAIFQVYGQEQLLSLETPFDHLRVSGNIHLELHKADAQQLIFVSEINTDELDIENDKAVLSLKTKTELNNAPAIKLKINYVSLDKLEVTKGGRVQSTDTLITDVLHLDLLNGGKSELYIKVDSLSARVNQGADLILYGNTRSQFVNAYTWGNYLAYDLVAVDSYVKAATGAQVKVNTSRLLDANATSRAFVGYLTEPEQKKVKTSLGGTITSQTE